METTEQVFRNAACRKRQPVVYGLRMSPLTLGHVFLLFEIESPILGFSDRDPDPSDYMMAVLVCSLPWRKASKAVNQRRTVLFFSFWRWLCRKKIHAIEIRKFRAWWESERKPVPTKCPTPNGNAKWRSLGAPMPYRLLALCMHLFHMSEGDAKDLPFSHAECLFCAIEEWNGRIELKDPETDDLLEFAMAEDAKRFNPDGSRKEQNPCPS